MARDIGTDEGDLTPIEPGGLSSVGGQGILDSLIRIRIGGGDDDGGGGGDEAESG